MDFDWKIIGASILLALAFIESDATLTEQQQRGNHQSNQNSLQHPQQHPFHHQPPHLHQPTTNFSERTTNKCVIEVPTVALKAYPHAKLIRMGSSMHLSFIETCCAGYRTHKLRGIAGGTICVPICENCLNGHCVRPGECECFDGFVKSDNGDCVFTCPISCLNGQCYLDGTCKCYRGYKLDETKKFCRPICSEGCYGRMQNCSAPETCGCSRGFTLKENGCRAICEPDCGLGGDCIDPNVCTCRVDFTLKDGVCQSNCYQKCENGICLSKNRCICYAGFKYHEKTMTCIPV